MKKWLAIVNSLLVAAVLFTMLFQSFHAFEHYEAELSETKCHHHYGATKHEITHQHHNFDHCLVCDFSFSGFLKSDALSFRSNLAFNKIPYFLTADKVFLTYPGKTCSLRGPPTFIV